MDTPTHVFEYVFENPSAQSENENENESGRDSNSYTYSASDGARGVSDSSSGFVCVADGGL
jgi:hypothetical protein